MRTPSSNRQFPSHFASLSLLLQPHINETLATLFPILDIIKVDRNTTVRANSKVTAWLKYATGANTSQRVIKLSSPSLRRYLPLFPSQISTWNRDLLRSRFGKRRVLLDIREVSRTLRTGTFQRKIPCPEEGSTRFPLLKKILFNQHISIHKFFSSRCEAHPGR
jgi:hypothetical protein